MRNLKLIQLQLNKAALYYRLYTMRLFILNILKYTQAEMNKCLITNKPKYIRQNAFRGYEQCEFLYYTKKNLKLIILILRS